MRVSSSWIGTLVQGPAGVESARRDFKWAAIVVSVHDVRSRGEERYRRTWSMVPD